MDGTVCSLNIRVDAQQIIFYFQQGFVEVLISFERLCLGKGKKV